MNNPTVHTSRSSAVSMETNKVLRNTYTLLGMTLTWAAVVAGVSMAMNLPYPGIYLGRLLRFVIFSA